MLNRTRAALDAYYAPHNRRLARSLSWRDVDVWRVSTPLGPAAYAQGSSIRYRRYGPYFPSNQPTSYAMPVGWADAEAAALEAKAAKAAAKAAARRARGGRG
jgi:hypothetical protein